MFRKFLVKQLRQWIFFGEIWLLHLDIQKKLHIKHWFILSSSMQLQFGIPIMKLRQIWRKCRRQQPGGLAGDGETPVASTICLTNLTGHPWRTASLSSSVASSKGTSGQRSGKGTIRMKFPLQKPRWNKKDY